MMRDSDFLPDCLIPVFNPDFGSRGDSEEIPPCASKSDHRHTDMRSSTWESKRSVRHAHDEPRFDMCCQSKGNIPSRDSVVK